MEYINYEDKDKTKRRGIDIEQLLILMSELEQFNGTTKEKIIDNYYEVKKQLREILLHDDSKVKKKVEI